MTGAFQYIANQWYTNATVVKGGEAFVRMLDQKIDALRKASFYVGAGGASVVGPLAVTADTGIAFDMKGNLCLQTTECFGLGVSKDVGGALGITVQVQQGLLTEGQQRSFGPMWMGGKGLAGEGQIQYGPDGWQASRGLFGVGYSANSGAAGSGVSPKTATVLACTTTTVICAK